MYALFPGEGYKHRQTMIDRNLVFLDFPDLKLPQASVDYLKREFTHQVARSEAIKDWISGGKMDINKPMLNVSHYANTARGKKRGKYINALEGLHLEAKKGELVIIPTAGYYGDIMIGEFTESAGKIRYVSPNPSYDDFLVPARRVKWIGKKPQHQVTEEFLKAIRTSNPLVLVKKSHRRPLYDAAYPSYMLDDEVHSTFTVKGQSFTARDGYFFQEFLNYAAALAEHVCEDRDDNTADFKSDISTAIWSLDDHSYIPDLSININSPGIISLLSSRVTPLIASALFSLALASCDAAGVAHMPNFNDVGVTIAQIADDPCAIQVEKAVRFSLENMNYDEWQKMCKKIHHLNTDPQIFAPAKVE